MSGTTDVAAGFRWEGEPVRRDRGLLGAAPLEHEPALDGLRAVAVLAVVLFHARFGWIPGGFLGVSTFFTLSGFLITSLLLREWSRRGSVLLRGFWRRRFRRLLAASWTTVGLVVAAGALGVWSTDQRRALRGDVPWSLAELVNWHFIAGDRSYGSKFVAPSPLEHFWSLAVEQQFYVLLPLLVVGVLGLARRRQWRAPVAAVAAALGAVVGVSALLNGLAARSSVDRAYFGTDTRAAELAVGALLACACVGGFRPRSPRVRRALDAAGVAGLLGSGVLWATASVASRWLYPWGLLATAAASTALVVGGLQGGVLGRLLGSRPLVRLGAVSYGVYLLHWPVFLWLTPVRTGLGEWPLFALRMLVTLVGAEFMFRLLERPVRLGGRIPIGRGPLVAAVAAVALLGATVLTTSGLGGPSRLQVASAAPTTTAPPPPLRVAVLGDRLAASLTPLTVRGLSGGGRRAVVTVDADPDCGLAVGGWVSRPDGTAERDVLRCGGSKERWISGVVASRPDVVLVWAGVRDLRDRLLSQEDPWQPSSAPGVAELLGAGAGELLDGLRLTGAHVVVLTVPPLANRRQMGPRPTPRPSRIERRELFELAQAAEIDRSAPAAAFQENDPARIAAWNSLLRGISQRRGITVLDASTFLGALPGGALAPGVRHDGVALTPEAAARLGGWLLPQLVAAADRPPPAAAQLRSGLLDAPVPPAPPPSPRRRAVGRDVRALVVGDSVARNVGDGLLDWTRGGRGLHVGIGAQFGCPVSRGGRYRFMRDSIPVSERCDWSRHYPDLLRSEDPDVAVLMSGIWEVADRVLPGDDRWRHVGDPELDAYVLREFVAAVDLLGSRGAKVVLVTFPGIESGRAQGFTGLPESEPFRMDRLNDLLRRAAALRPGVATVLDLRTWLRSRPGGELDPTVRSDGIHFDDRFLPELGRWVGPQLVALGRA